MCFLRRKSATNSLTIIPSHMTRYGKMLGKSLKWNNMGLSTQTCVIFVWQQLQNV